MAGGHDSLAALFRELTELTILEEGSPNSFRARAYEKAMQEKIKAAEAAFSPSGQPSDQPPLSQ